MAKTLADTFLYGKSPDYNNRILQFITKSERINTKSTEFADVLFDIKRSLSGPCHRASSPPGKAFLCPEDPVFCHQELP